jgi:hypothetical protein
MRLRRLFSCLGLALWLLPLAVVLALWGRSHFRLDELSRVTDDYQTQALVSYQGGLHFIRSGDTASPRPLAWDTLIIPKGATREHLYIIGSVRWQYVGFSWIGLAPRAPPPRAAPSPATPGPVPARPRPLAPLAPWLMLRPLDAWIVPYWALALPFCLPPLRRTFLFARRQLRRRRQQCPACGYDLRASPARCPECGQGAVDHSAEERPTTGALNTDGG